MQPQPPTPAAQTQRQPRQASPLPSLPTRAAATSTNLPPSPAPPMCACSGCAKPRKSSNYKTCSRKTGLFCQAAKPPLPTCTGYAPKGLMLPSAPTPHKAGACSAYAAACKYSGTPSATPTAAKLHPHTPPHQRLHQRPPQRLCKGSTSCPCTPRLAATKPSATPQAALPCPCTAHGQRWRACQCKATKSTQGKPATSPTSTTTAVTPAPTPPRTPHPQQRKPCYTTQPPSPWAG